MLKSTVEQVIGQEYKKWEWQGEGKAGYGNRIFIDAPTGSGKTTFILQTLLPYYSAQGRKILYLVNRRILKAQIREMVADLPHSQYAAIRVELYQEIEKKIMAVHMEHNMKDSDKGDGYNSLQKLSEYDCLVCDEAHYFLTDSTYNTNTVLSYRWIQKAFCGKVCIFMSATVDELKTYMEKNNLHDYGEINSLCYGIPKCGPSISGLRKRSKLSRGEEYEKPEKDHGIISYHVSRDYGYIGAKNIRIIDNRKALVDLVVEGSQKWLVFVDNINYGKALRNSVKKRLRKLKNKDSSEEIEGSVILITSGYKREQNSTDEVDRIIRTQAFSAKVLIVTAVLDNGVNIKDIDVRNVVLFADTETEFIQMLGRKRKDAQLFKLYIYGYDKKHFSNRKRQLRKQKEIADQYLCAIEEKIKNLTWENSSESWDDPNQKPLDECEERGIESQHKKLMQEMLDGRIDYEDVRHSFTVYDGKWFLNMLALQHIEDLNHYYGKVIKKFETEGEDAFAREQLSWLEKTGKIADEIIKESKLKGEKESRRRVTAALREIAGKKKVKEEYIKFTEGILTDLRVLAAYPVDFPDETKRTDEQLEKWDTVKREFNKTGKVLSKQSMDFLRTYCRIPFRVENDRKGGYMVRLENNKDENM